MLTAESYLLSADKLNAERFAIERLRSEQRRAARDAIAATSEREKEYAMLGVNDNLIEELIVLYWKEAISNQLSAVSQDAKLNAES